MIVTNPNDQDIISKTVTHNEHIYFHSGITGWYDIRYVQNNEEKRDCWIALRDDAVSYSSVQSGDTIYVINKEGQKVRTQVVKNGGIFILPSQEHRENKSSTKPESLTIADLAQQVYD
ncbi:hypothetical protein [Salinithrix halophila]|uniref:Uncharacterized protein n=1 Tax=Salinithrix halophila TaxID=1485204 RepID=A0ABV8JFG8_9BACL